MFAFSLETFLPLIFISILDTVPLPMLVPVPLQPKGPATHWARVFLDPRVEADVELKITFQPERLAADVTLERLDACVDRLVGPKRHLSLETLLADAALERSDVGVHETVGFEQRPAGESLPANVACVWRLFASSGDGHSVLCPS